MFMYKPDSTNKHLIIDFINKFSQFGGGEMSSW